MVCPAIFGLSSYALTNGERTFFSATMPLGFILFSRNCQTPEQVRALCIDLRGITGRADTPILIDQEGGRVARLKDPHWRHPPSARAFGDLWDRDPKKACRAAMLNGQLIGADLRGNGINVDCAPVLDVPVPGSHDIIGDRAFHAKPEAIADLGRAFADGLMAAGVLPVVKHIPGHGRAAADSHTELPVVDATLQGLENDFMPFRALRELPLAMTAHVLYRALDLAHPATTSALIIADIIRKKIGFKGLLMSDDISSNMRALSGGFARRASDSIAAGCDAVLHCDGDLTAMQVVAAALPPLSDEGAVRWARASFLIVEPEPVDTLAVREELDWLLR